MSIKRLLLMILLITVTIGGLIGISRAGPRISIATITVLASQDSNFRDPRLSALIGELESVFRYSSYRQLSRDRMNLGIGETGITSLPGNRQLKITPIRVGGNRAELKIIILKQRRQIFQTVIQLLNGGSMTVGGPKYRNGYLLFNISSSF